VLVYAEQPFLVHVDVGFTGLTGASGSRAASVRWRGAGRPVKDELIGWKFVQPLPESGTVGALQVTLRQDQLKQLHAGELADIIEELDRDERLALVRSIGPGGRCPALQEADLAVQTSVLRDLDSELAADILEEMEPAVAADVIEELPADAQKSIMAAMEDESGRSSSSWRRPRRRRRLADDRRLRRCADSLTASEALAEVRRQAEEVEYITYLYCVDEEKRLRGVVSLRDLILSQPTVPSPDHAPASGDAGAEGRLGHRRGPVLEVWVQGPTGGRPRGPRRGIVTFRHSFEELIPHYYKLAG